MNVLKLPLIGVNHVYNESTLVVVGVWKDSVLGIREGDSVSKWFRKYLQDENLELVRFVGVRPTSAKYRVANTSFADNQVSFSDGYPMHLTSTASLKDLE